MPESTHTPSQNSSGNTAGGNSPSGVSGISLPRPDLSGDVRWPDGAFVRPLHPHDSKSSWYAFAPGSSTAIVGDDGRYRKFDSARAAARALLDLSLGPAKVEAPRLPDGYDASMIPADLEFRGEVRGPREGELYLGRYGQGAYRASCGHNDARPILVPKAAAPATDDPARGQIWRAMAAESANQPQEKAMDPTNPPAKGKPMIEKDRDFCLDTLKNTMWGPAHRGAIGALAAECRRLQRESEPGPPPQAVPSAYVRIPPRPRWWQVALMCGVGTLAVEVVGKLAPFAAGWVLHHLAR